MIIMILFGFMSAGQIYLFISVLQGKGTPQFVVFAPMPNEEEDADERNMEVSRKRTRKRKKPRKEYDYDEEYTENVPIKHRMEKVISQTDYFA